MRDDEQLAPTCRSRGSTTPSRRRSPRGQTEEQKGTLPSTDAMGSALPWLLVLRQGCRPPWRKGIARAQVHAREGKGLGKAQHPETPQKRAQSRGKNYERCCTPLLLPAPTHSLKNSGSHHSKPVGKDQHNHRLTTEGEELRSRFSFQNNPTLILPSFSGLARFSAKWGQQQHAPTALTSRDTERDVLGEGALGA